MIIFSAITLIVHKSSIIFITKINYVLASIINLDLSLPKMSP
jgi:hypothetical protein